jgi:hypothetical protein
MTEEYHGDNMKVNAKTAHKKKKKKGSRDLRVQVRAGFYMGIERSELEPAMTK